MYRHTLHNLLTFLKQLTARTERELFFSVLLKLLAILSTTYVSMCTATAEVRLFPYLQWAEFNFGLEAAF